VVGGGATIASRRWKSRPSADGLVREPGATSYPGSAGIAPAVTLSASSLALGRQLG
jgi:hypothetical protein